MGAVAITVVFSVPVHVEVDERVGTVLSAKVDDEAVVGPVDVIVLDERPDLERIERAMSIADDAPWPGWMFGA